MSAKTSSASSNCSLAPPRHSCWAYRPPPRWAEVLSWPAAISKPSTTAATRAPIPIPFSHRDLSPCPAAACASLYRWTASRPGSTRPPAIFSFQPGELAIRFSSVQELAGALLALAEILDNAEEFAAFEERHVPRPTPLDQGTDDRAVLEKDVRRNGND